MAELSITSREDLEEWLMGKPFDWAVVVAVRAALRVLPLSREPIWSEPGWGEADRPLPMFRATAITIAAARTPLNSTDRKTATDAAHAVYASQRDALFAAIPAWAVKNAYDSRKFGASDTGTYQKAGYAVEDASAFALAQGGSPVDCWQEVSFDCNGWDGKRTHLDLLAQPLWHEEPRWFTESWRVAAKWLDSREWSFWQSWYMARLDGMATALPGFDEDTDRRFHRFLLEQNDDWWRREPAEVNADIAEWVSELQRRAEPPTDEQLVQNPQVLTFSTDEQGRSVVDPEVAPNGLQDDADARDNHAEIVRLINRALVSTLDAPTQQKAISEPAELLLEATGASVAETRPRSFVLRARELIRQVRELESEQSMGVPLSEEQRKAFLPLVAALEMLAKFDPKLAKLWAGKIDGDAIVLTREQLGRLVDALRSTGQAGKQTLEILETTVEHVSPNAEETDPARRTASETLRNVFRSMGKTAKQVDGTLKMGERVFKLIERGGQIWMRVKDYLPDDDVIARILEWLGKGGS